MTVTLQDISAKVDDNDPHSHIFLHSRSLNYNLNSATTESFPFIVDFVGLKSFLSTQKIELFQLFSKVP